MYYSSAESEKKPEKVTLENLPDGKTIIRLASNITESQTDDEQTFYRYEEEVFTLPAGREETTASIEEDFDEWWSYGSTDTDAEITIEDRIAALEDMYLSELA